MFFALCAVVTAVSAVAAVRAADARSIWWLAATVISLAGCLVIMQEPMIAASYLVLHLGGIAVVLATVVRATVVHATGAVPAPTADPSHPTDDGDHPGPQLPADTTVSPASASTPASSSSWLSPSLTSLAAVVLSVVAGALVSTGLIVGLGMDSISRTRSAGFDSPAVVAGEIFQVWWLPVILLAALIAATAVGVVAMVAHRRGER